MVEANSITTYARQLLKRRDTSSFLIEKESGNYFKTVNELISLANNSRMDSYCFFNLSPNMAYIRYFYNSICSITDNEYVKSYTTKDGDVILLHKIHDLTYVIYPGAKPSLLNKEEIRKRLTNEDESEEFETLLKKEISAYKQAFKEFFSAKQVPKKDMEVFIKKMNADLDPEPRKLTTLYTRDAIILDIKDLKDVDTIASFAYEGRKTDSFASFLSYNILANYLEQKGNGEESVSVEEILRMSEILYKDSKAKDQKKRTTLKMIDNTIRYNGVDDTTIKENERILFDPELIQIFNNNDFEKRESSFEEYKKEKEEDAESNFNAWKKRVKELARVSLADYCEDRGLEKKDLDSIFDEYLDIYYFQTLKDRAFAHIYTNRIINLRSIDVAKSMRVGRTNPDRRLVIYCLAKDIMTSMICRDNIVLDNGLKLNANVTSYIDNINKKLQFMGFPILDEKRFFDGALMWSSIIANVNVTSLAEAYESNVAFFEKLKINL